MSTEPTPFSEYAVEVEPLGVLTVLAPEGEPGYRVRLPDGQVTAFPAVSGDPSEANAAADIAHALANPPEVTEPVPQVISPMRFVMAIREVLGLQEAHVFALISQIPDPLQQERIRDAWGRATEFRRDNPFLAVLAQLNGNTESQVDQVFRYGAALQLD